MTPADRRCGDCHACCIVFFIADLDKAAGVPCSHLSPGTRPCAIYDRRPEPCRTYACSWLQGVGKKRHRPNRLGFVLDGVSGEEDERTALIRVFELQRNAAREPPGSLLVQGLAEAYPVAVLYDGTIQAICTTGGRWYAQAEYEALRGIRIWVVSEPPQEVPDAE
jgi:hypothetical protein